jgi:serine/threonine-protein kinase
MGADPAARPPSPTALVDELERALTGEPATPPAKPAPRRADPVLASPPSGGYVPHSVRRRGGARLVPVAALLTAIALGAAAIIAFAGSSSSDLPKQPAQAAKKPKHKKSHPQAAAPAPAPAGSQPAPAPTQAPASNYQVPVAAGHSSAQGWQLNTQGKQLSDSGNYTAAIPVLERALRAYPAGTTAAGNIQFAYTLFNLGQALRAGGRPADAVPVLQERLKNPDQRGTVQAELDSARSAAGQG